MARATLERPPPKPFLGIGALFLALNHMAVVLGLGLHPEALVSGCWLLLMGGWSLLGGRSFDAVWVRVNPSGVRTIGFVLLTLVAALASAAVVARVGYGRPLLG